MSKYNLTTKSVAKFSSEYSLTLHDCSTQKLHENSNNLSSLCVTWAKKNFATSFVVRLYLLLEIYLLYIQFIVDSSLYKLDNCNLYFIVDIFRSYSMVFPSTPKGFPHKIWCSCVVVFMWCLLKLFCFYNIAIAW